jgi:hypothetical protein
MFDPYIGRVGVCRVEKDLDISFVGIESFQYNELIALDSGGFVDGPRVEASEPEVAFGPCDEEGRCLVNRINTLEIQIPTIDNVKGFRFEGQLVEDIDVVNLAVGDNDERGDTSPGVQKRMQFHSAFVGSEFCSRGKRKTEVDGGGV